MLGLLVYFTLCHSNLTALSFYKFIVIFCFLYSLPPSLSISFISKKLVFYSFFIYLYIDLIPGYGRFDSIVCLCVFLLSRPFSSVAYFVLLLLFDCQSIFSLFLGCHSNWAKKKTLHWISFLSAFTSFFLLSWLLLFDLKFKWSPQWWRYFPMVFRFSFSSGWQLSI